MNKIVFLNLAVMPYHVAVFKELTKSGYEIIVYWYAKSPKTSYRAPKIENVILRNRFEFTNTDDLYQDIKKIDPCIIYCCGWTDTGYNKISECFKKRGIPTVVMSDTQWRGGKQWINRILSPFRHRRYFSHFFAAGILQYDYARKLGYKTDQILMYSLSGDTELFNKVDIEKKADEYPKRIMYVGRFVHVKAIDALLEAWNRIEDKRGWKLELIGEGPLKDRFKQSEDVIVMDFMSQESLAEEAQNAGCFILPSRFEPWALVIHEFAAAGMPLLCSKYCGATKHFLINGYNGYEFDPNNIDTIVKSIEKIISANTEELLTMSRRSRLLSKSITPEITANTLTSIIR